MNMVKAFIGICLLVLLSACANPLPEARRHYAGDWRGEEMSLTISLQGQVEYQRQNGSTKTSVSGPLQGFEGDDFVVGLAFFTTRFHVTEPPHEVGGKWQMVVDGVLLTRLSN